MVGQLGTWTLTALLLIIVPRYMGPGSSGALNLGWTYSGLAVTLAGFGVGPLITREVARSPERMRNELASGIWLLAMVGVIGIAVVWGVAFVAGYGGNRLLAVQLCSLGIPAILVSNICLAALQGIEEMRRAAALDIIAKALMLFAALSIVLSGQAGVAEIGAGSTLVFYAVALMQLRTLSHKYGFRLRTWNMPAAFALVRASIPFFWIGLFLALYTSAGVILVAHFGTDEDIAFYAVPMRLFGTMLFIPTAIITVIYPRLTALRTVSTSDAALLSVRTVRLIAELSVPMALAGVAFSGPGIHLLLGERFATADSVVAVLALSLIPTGIGTVAGRVALAHDRQRTMALISLASFVLNVALGLALIPFFESQWGNAALGAAIGLLAVETGLMGLKLALVPKSSGAGALLGRTFVVATFVSGVALLATWPLVGMIAGGLAATVVYAAIMVLGGAVQPATMLAQGRSLLARPQAAAQ